VQPGENTIRLPVGSFIDSSGRSLNLENMRGIYVYKKEVVSREVLFFDYFRKERKGERVGLRLLEVRGKRA
jgi:hypothetical protein